MNISNYLSTNPDQANYLNMSNTWPVYDLDKFSISTEILGSSIEKPEFVESRAGSFGSVSSAMCTS